ncbi:hypothetical protein NL676_005771 [Syzygium grande]|nr:hypothetical protein NL676_005771 [Syzygium grande]
MGHAIRRLACGIIMCSRPPLSRCVSGDEARLPRTNGSRMVSSDYISIVLNPNMPRRNVKLLVTSAKCGAKGLNLTGIIHVTGSEVTDYCNGCAQWTKDVLTCIHLVKRDFWFANNATVELINNTISQGCDTNSDIVMLGVKKSGGMRNYSRTYMALFSALVLAIFLFST